MQIASAITFAVAMIATASIMFRCMAWSFDSPVLRRAWRKRQIGPAARLGFLAVLGLSGLILYRLGVREFSLPAGFFCSMLILFGSATVMFCGMLVEDLREVFFNLADRFGMPSILDKWDWSTRREVEPENRPCVEQRHCSEEVRQPCGANGFSHPWRPADRPRTGQHQ